MPGNVVGEVRCKGTAILAFLMVAATSLQAQWITTNGPSAGSISGVTILNGSVYACSNNTAIFRSTDDGETWSFLGGPSKLLFMDELDQALGVLFIPARQAIYRSTDEGRTWQLNPSRKLGQYRSLMTVADTLYLAGDGLHRSIDRGETWEEIVDTTFSKRIYFNDAAVHDRTIFGSTSDGVVAYDLQTRKWSKVLDGYTDCVESNGSVLIATRYDTVLRSTVDGWTWKGHRTQLYPWKMYAHGRNFFMIEHKHGMFISDDEGLTWRPLLRTWYVGDTYDLAVSDNTIYAGTSVGLFRGDPSSTDMHEITTLPASNVSEIIEIDNGLLAIDEHDGVHRFTNLAGWEEIAIADTALAPMAPIVHTGDYLVARAKNFGILHSQDGGRTWQRTCRCFNSYEPEPISTIYAAGDTVYLSTTQGFYRSTDNALSWTKINSDLTSVSRLTDDGTSLWSATSAKGLWMSADKGATWTQTWTDPRYYFSDLVYARDSVYAATNKGLLVFDRSGSFVDRRYDSTRVYDIFIDNGRFVAATDSGLYIEDELVSEELPALRSTAVARSGDELFVAYSGAGIWKHNRWTVSSVEYDRTFPLDNVSIDQLIRTADRVIMTDLLGSVVLDAQGQSAAADMAGLAHGVYVVRVETEGAIRTLKLLR